MTEPTIFVKKDQGVVQFGIHQGKRWCDVPLKYIEFLISDECYTPEDNKRIARIEKQQRRILKGQMEWWKL